MELVDYVPQTQGSVYLPYERITLAPVSDVQVGAAGCDLDRFERHFHDVCERGAYPYLLGDAVDHASPSTRKKILNAGLYESTQEGLIDKARRDEEKILKILKWSDKWLFVLEGHHYFDFMDGTTTDTHIADALGCPFLGTSTVFQIKFTRGSSSHLACQLFAHHGERSSMSTSLMTRWMELNLLPHWPTVDVFNVAHCHRAGGVKMESLVPMFGKHPSIKGKQRVLGVTGGYLKGYVVGHKCENVRPQGNYIERGIMPPVAVGGLLIHVTPVHTARFDYLDLKLEF